MFTGLVIGSIMTAVGTAGYVITVKKEREEKKLAEKHAEKMRTMEELLNLRKETDKMDFAMKSKSKSIDFEKISDETAKKIPKGMLGVLMSINKFKNGTVDKDTIKIIKESPLGMDFVGLIMYYDIIKSNRKKWVDGLESEIQKNLKDKQ